MPDPGSVLSFAVIFCAAALQGLTGFGYSLFSLPVLALLMPLQSAVPMLVITSLFLNLMVFLHARKHAGRPSILPLFLAGVAGLPLGIWLLKVVNETLLSIAIGILVMLSAAAYLKGLRVRVKNERVWMVPVGLMSGILNGSTTFSGPPVILFFANQERDRHSFRAGLGGYFLLLNLVAVPGFLAGGMLTTEVLISTAWRFPAVIAGALAGIGLSGRIDDKKFRKLALAFLCLLGFASALVPLLRLS